MESRGDNELSTVSNEPLAAVDADGDAAAGTDAGSADDVDASCVCSLLVCCVLFDFCFFVGDRSLAMVD